MIVLRLFGGFEARADEREQPREIPRRLAAIAAILAVSGRRGVPRDRVLTLLWPEVETEKARHALAQSLYSLRRLMGESALHGTTTLVLNDSVVSADVAEFQAAVAASDHDRAVRIAEGPFLDGFHVSGAPEFERWVDAQRDNFARQLAASIVVAATAHRNAGRHREATHLLRKRAVLQPLDAGGARDLMRALVAAGDATGAVQHGRVHTTLVRQELDVEPDAHVTALLRELETHTTPPEPKPIAPAPLAAMAAPLPPVADAPPLRVPEGDIVGAKLLRRAIWGAAVGILALSTAAVLLATNSDGRASALKHGRLAVAPFEVEGFRNDVVMSTNATALVVAALSERDPTPISDPALVAADWRGLGTDGAWADRVERLVSRLGQNGVQRVVTGTVVGDGARAAIHVVLLNAKDGSRRAHIALQAPIDSVPSLIDQAATVLVASDIGLARAYGGVGPLVPAALKAFVAGEEAYRRAEFELAASHYAAALATDSSFAPAAVGLAMAADWMDDGVVRAAGLRAALGHQDRLSTTAASQMAALLGERFPDPSTREEQLAAWENVAKEHAERPELWVEYARRMFFDGPQIGIPRTAERAAAAYQRALSVSPDYVPAIEGMVVLEASIGSGDRARPWLDRLDASKDSLRLLPQLWTIAARRGDASALERLSRRFEQADDGVLRRIAQSALANGVGLTDGWKAVRLRERASVGTWTRVDALLAEHAYALNTGRPSAALEATRNLEQEPSTNGAHLRLRILDALYAGGDSASAAHAALALERRVASGSGRSVDRRAVRISDQCVLSQWRVWQRDYRALPGALRELRAPVASVSSPAPITASGQACAILLEAIAEGLRRSPRAEAAIDLAEGMALTGPAIGDLRHYATLALARVREVRGELTDALQVVQRRTVERGWPRYLAAGLLLEARVAQRLNDETRARRALRHYLALRTDPEGAARAEVATARRAWEQLERRGGPRLVNR